MAWWCRLTWVIVAALWHSQTAVAHVAPATLPGQHSIWSVDLVSLVLLLLVGVWHIRGSRQPKTRTIHQHRLFRKRVLQFWLGWFVLLIALASPIDALGEELFSVHMVQHELLMMIAGPLLVLSRPSSFIILGAKSLFIPLVRGLTVRTFNSVSFVRRLLNPGPAWLLHVVGLWAWHVPKLFEASLNNTWIHTLQHITFLVVALVFWHSVLRGDRNRSMAAVVSLFTTAIHASLLGALLTFSPKIWYPSYAQTTGYWGLTPLQDQQLGGLIMWMPAGIVFIAVALYLMAQILRNTDQTTVSALTTVNEKR